jgi:hypothetical protein
MGELIQDDVVVVGILGSKLVKLLQLWQYHRLDIRF